MKAIRIIQMIFLLIVIAYLLLLHSNNDQTVIMPFFINLPPALLIALALILGWFSAWLPARMQLWRKARELNKLNKRIGELEENSPNFGQVKEPRPPIIPDRPNIPDEPSNSDEDPSSNEPT